MNLHEFLDEIEKLVDENQPKDWTKVTIIMYDDSIGDTRQVEGVMFSDNEIEVF